MNTEEQSGPPKKKSFFNNIFWIGSLSFFGGISQDIFAPILPLYLANVLGFDKSFIGLSEGLVTASSSIFKIVSGFLTDKFRSRKSIIFVGYGLSMISRPLLAVFTSTPAVLGLRFVDGVGKGVKDSPKDALIADASEAGSRGKSFGVARALDTLGSVAGPLILFLLLYVFAGNPLKYHYIFLITAIPLVCTLGILIVKVRESPAIPVTTKESAGKNLPMSFYLFMGVMMLFSLGNSSDAFLALRAQNIGIALLGIPLLYALFNLMYAAASIPLGSLSDGIGREKVIVLGFFAYALSYLGFALATQKYEVWLLFAFYGIYYATTQGVAKALIADLVPATHRGRAYGIYNSVIGIMALPASIIAGYLWDTYGPASPFFFGAAVAGCACVGLLGFIYFLPKMRRA